MCIVPNKDGYLPWQVDPHLIAPRRDKGASDDFNRADGPLENSTPFWTRDGVVGGAGAAIISNGMLGAVGTAQQSCYYCPDCGSTDQYVQVVVKGVSGSPGMFVCCRMTDRSNFVGLIVNTGTGGLEVWKNIGGSYTALTTNGPPVNVNDMIRLEVQGNNWRAYINTVQVRNGTIDAPSLTSTRQGLMCGFINQNPTYDNFLAGRL